ncbi:phosphopantothenoylcysteine decarboxylase subunit VHS3-like [Cynara cardunculus var. scolymus]|uniref:phosphopantothenoylcysteine decarboxylase subunit VHS3-like n=1 Tax=Cynara cardunculus var. scolymus TaxID=59895 RepID=UPI000D623EEE|nr:phosphopantothenoylcysteine decarboxylase subunit VHS3-like [Cynara cardunculus var. scolymus]
MRANKDIPAKLNSQFGPDFERTCSASSSSEAIVSDSATQSDDNNDDDDNADDNDADDVVHNDADDDANDENDFDNIFDDSQNQHDDQDDLDHHEGKNKRHRLAETSRGDEGVSEDDNSEEHREQSPVQAALS